MNIRLYNARILTMEDDVSLSADNVVFPGEIWVKDDRIASVIRGEDSGKSPPVWDMEIDCEDNLLMPGFKDAHTHSAMTFLRSYADDVPLQQWLEDKIFPMEKKISGEDIYHFTKLAILEYLTSGITSIFEMYLTPDHIARACVDMGMRCVLTSGLNNFTSSVERQEDEYIRLNHYDPLISYQLGFHSEYTCSEDLLHQMSQLVHKYQAPVYTHFAETAKEVRACKARYGRPLALTLYDMGLFDYGGGGYHCVHMSEGDLEIFRGCRLYAITNPSSNLKLASGIAPIAEFERRGIPVAIGTDGAASNNCLDMFREMFLVTALQKVSLSDAAAVDALEVLHMATAGGARAMGLADCDVLAEGKCADMVLLDLQKPNMQPLNNITKNIVYSGSKQNVKMTMIDGKILYEDGVFHVGTAPEEIYAKVNESITRMKSE